ncbi:MAG: hypothetical protein DRQ88_13350 [Epsilonproteobacteria bacterium]|nr:MAG: hypothetical protein DRQ89_13490 [Campylobacterota bacterium]RLA62699.1 MAG: hypothetical protein DRQ88_13350 [Campylobacterota bacterium]
MRRKLFTDLVDWKNSRNRKPLILRGARQVGKTFLLKKFGASEFPVFHYFNFEAEPQLKSFFESNLDPLRIINALALKQGKQINVQTDLVIFDEIQNCPRALTSLKYFCEDLPTLNLACAGSHMGLIFMDGSFPVGKVHFLDLYPMNFEEFLKYRNQMAWEVFEKSKLSLSLEDFEHEILWNHLKEYYVVGGMPESVKIFIESSGGFQQCREIQNNLIEQYINDFHKHSGKVNALQIATVFKDISKQLSLNQDGSAGKYKFREVLKGKIGYRELSGPIEWLTSSSLAIKIGIANRAEVPLTSFCRPNIFKLFIFDIGILGAMLNIHVDSLLNQKYGITKGYFAENFVAQELLASGEQNLISWKENKAEIEFLIQSKNEIIPIEVKSGTNLKAKSLASFLKRYNPRKAIKVSAKNFKVRKDQATQNIPLYSVSFAIKKISQQ